MSRRMFAALFLAGLLSAAFVASFQHTPGYMDADYYYAGGLRLAEGQGSEPYLWNYLNDPEGLPAPAFAYWMPGVSLLAALGLLLFGPLDFWGARTGFLLLAGCIPPLTALLALRLTGQRRQALLAGMLALLPVFYLAYLPTTDAFAVYMVLGSLFFLLAGAEGAGWSARRHAARYLGLGLLVGLLHLTRADGLLWAAAAGWVLLVRLRGLVGRERAARFAGGSLALLAGYLLVMTPWYARNLAEWGSLFPPGGGRALWITTYEQTMIYPASLLTQQRWLAAGWSAHVKAWLAAAGAHLQTAVAVQGSIVLFPFLLIGLWRLRRRLEVRLAAGMWLLTAVVMTLVFPFAGVNGSFFHSGAALQPLLWAAVPAGLDAAAGWYARLRRLESPLGLQRFLTGVLLLTCLVLTIALTAQRITADRGGHAWNERHAHYQQVEAALQRHGAVIGEGVLVNNPPGYWLASRRPAAVIPDGDPQVLLAAARRYDLRYVVLEKFNPVPLADLYHRRAQPPELEYLETVGETPLFRILPAEE